MALQRRGYRRRTGSVLALASVQFANAGTYDVAVTNLYGATNSAGAA